MGTGPAQVLPETARRGDDRQTFAQWETRTPGVAIVLESCHYLRFLPLPEAGLQARLHLRPLLLQDAENDRVTEGAIFAPHIATEYTLASGPQLGDSSLRTGVQGVCLDLDASVPAVVETVSHQQQFGFGVDPGAPLGLAVQGRAQVDALVVEIGFQ